MAGLNKDVLAGMLNDYCQQRKSVITQNIAPQRVEIQPSPYGIFTKEQLDMRRKIEILKRKSPSVQGKLTINQQYRNVILNGTIPRQSEVITNICDLAPTSSSASDIPGPPFTLQLDPTVPVYNLYNSIFTRNYGILPAQVLEEKYQMFINSNIPVEDNMEEIITQIYMTPSMSQGASTYNFVVSSALFISGTITINRNLQFLLNRDILESRNSLPFLQRNTIIDNSFTVFTLEQVVVNIYYNDKLYSTSLDGGPTDPYAVFDTTPIVLDLRNVTGDFFAKQFIGNIKIYNIYLPTFKKRFYNFRLKLKVGVSGYIPPNVNINTNYLVNITQNNYDDFSGCEVISSPSTQIVEPFNTSTIVVDTLTFDNLRINGADIHFTSASQIDGYIISTIPGSFEPYIVDSKTTFQSLTGMEQNTNYKISVIAFNTTTKETSTPKYVEILTYSVPTTVSNVTISDLSLNSLKVTFTPSELYVTGYYITLTPSDDPALPLILPENSTQFNISQLTESTHYTANITTTGVYGNSIPYYLTFLTKGHATTVQDISYSNLTARSVTISHGASENDVTSYVITFIPSITGSPFTYGVNASRIHTYNNLLTKLTQYTVEIKAVGVYGNSNVNTVTFTTFSPSTDVTNIQITNITNKTATISWNFSQYYVNNYLINIFPSPSSGGTILLPSTVNTYQLTNLNEVTQYNVFITAKGTYGDSVATNKSFTTFGTPTPITGFDYSNLTDKSVVINYNLSANSILYYLISFIPEIPSENNTFQIPNNINSVLYTGLTKLTIYTVTIKAVGVFGNSNSTSIRFSTLSPAFNINQLITTNITANTVTVSYAISQYTNYYNIIFDPSIVGSPFNTTATNRTYFDLSYLTTYTVSVKAVGTFGNSDTSTISFTTFSPASPITGLSYENLTGRTVTIKYDASIYYIEGYTYKLYSGLNRNELVNTIQVDSTVLSYTFNNLEYTTNYSVDVYAVGTYGNSEISTITFKTRSPATQPSSFSSTNVTASTTTLRFYPSQNDVLSYTLTFSPTIQDSPFTIIANQNDPSNVFLSYTYSGLSVLTTYTASIFAVGLYGNSTTARTTFTTFSPASPITNFTISDVSINIATIRFSQSIYNVVEYRAIIQPGDIFSIIPQPVNPTQQVIYKYSGLVRNTTYSGNIYAVGVYGNSVSYDFSFNTKSEASNITGLSVVNLTANSADISFNASLYDVLDYQLTLSPAPPVLEQPIVSVTPSFSFSNILEKLTTYTAYIFARGVYGNSDTIDISFTTFSPANPVENLRYSDLSINIITVLFNPSLYSYAYYIEITPGDISFNTTSIFNPITGLIPNTNYKLTVTALGTYGNSDASILRFVTFGPAQPVTLLRYENVTASEVSIIFNPSTSVEVVSYSVLFSPAIPGSPFITGDTINNYSGLNFATTYTVSVIALSKYANSEPTTTTFTTFRPASDIVLTVDSVRAFDISLSYTPSQYNVIGYYIDVSSTNTNSRVTQTVSNTTTSLNVSGLLALTPYIVGVKALGTYGNSAISSQTITTFSPALPVDISYDTLTATSVRIKYTASTYQYAYYITVNTSPVETNIQTTDLSYVVDGLTPGTNYTASVKALGIYGNSESSTITFITFNIAGNITNLRTTSVLSKTASIAYDSSPYTDYYAISLTNNSNMNNISYTTTDISFSFTGLSYTTNYSVSVYGVGVYGNSATSNISFTTFIDPTDVTGLTATNIKSDSVDVSYNPSQNYVTGYSITFNPAISGGATFVRTNTNNTFTGLSALTNYTVSVFAIGTYGNSVNTVSTSFTTFSPAFPITGLQTQTVNANTTRISYNESLYAINYEINLNNGYGSVTINDISYVFTGLLEESFYTASVKAIGTYGNSVASTVSFNTYSFPTSVSPIVLSYVGATNVIFSYSPSFNYLTGYSIILKQGITDISNITVNKNVTGYEFTSLNTTTNYSIQVYAIGTYGNSVTSNATFTTFDVPTNITGLIYSNLKPTSVDISYNASSNYVTGYRIEFSPAIDGSPFTTTALSRSFTGLTRLTSYTVSVKAIGTYGNSATSTVSFTTPSPAQEITGLTASSITGTSAKITYNVSLYSTGYKIDIFPRPSGYTYPVTINDTSYSILGLTVNTFYSVDITAIGTYGNSQPAIVEFTTKSTASDIQQLRITDVTSTSATVSFLQSVNDVSGYNISILPGSIPNVVISSSTLVQDQVVSYTYNNVLSFNTNYTVSVYAIGVYGNSNTSTVSFLTFRPASNISNLAVNTITSTSVVLTYDESLYNVSYYEFIFNPSITGSPFSLFGTYQLFTGLSDATNYTVSVKAVGVYGNSETRNISFTTTVDSPATYAIDISSSILADMSFTVISGIAYDVSAIPAETGPAVVRSTNINSPYRFNNLNKGMLYYVNLYAKKNGVYSSPTIYNLYNYTDKPSIDISGVNITDASFTFNSATLQNTYTGSLLSTYLSVFNGLNTLTFNGDPTNLNIVYVTGLTESTFYNSKAQFTFENTKSDVLSFPFVTYPGIPFVSLSEQTNTSLLFSFSYSSNNTYDFSMVSDTNTTYTKLNITDSSFVFEPLPIGMRFGLVMKSTSKTTNLFSVYQQTVYTLLNAPEVNIRTFGTYAIVDYSANPTSYVGTYVSTDISYSLQGAYDSSFINTENLNSYELPNNLIVGSVYNISVIMKYTNTSTMPFNGTFNTLTAPTNFSITSDLSTRGIVSFTPVSGSYTYDISVNPAVVSGGIVSKYYTGVTNGGIITGLAPAMYYTAYIFTVYNGIKSNPAITTFYTKAIAPTATIVTSDVSAQISYQYTGNTYTGAFSYVSYSYKLTGTSNGISGTTNASSFTITSLTESTTYDISFTAIFANVVSDTFTTTFSTYPSAPTGTTISVLSNTSATTTFTRSGNHTYDISAVPSSGTTVSDVSINSPYTFAASKALVPAKKYNVNLFVFSGVTSLKRLYNYGNIVTYTNAPTPTVNANGYYLNYTYSNLANSDTGAFTKMSFDYVENTQGKYFDNLSPDAINGLVGAYSVGKINSSYSGPTLKIRRGTDGALSDFYSNYTGALGTTSLAGGTSLTSWLNGATGYVDTWYDQSGKGKHATQSLTPQLLIVKKPQPNPYPTSTTTAVFDMSSVYNKYNNNNTFQVSYVGPSVFRNNDGQWGAHQLFDDNRTNYDWVVEGTSGTDISHAFTFPMNVFVSSIYIIPRNITDSNPSGVKLYVDNILVGSYTSTTLTYGVTGQYINYSGEGYAINCNTTGTVWRLVYTIPSGISYVSVGELEFWGYPNTIIQPSIDITNKRINFTGQKYFILPDGTVPFGDSTYTVMYKHGNIGNTNGGILGSGNYSTNGQSLAFRRSTTGYKHYWWFQDLDFGTYNVDNTVTEVYNSATKTRYGYVNNEFSQYKVEASARASTSGNNTIGVTSITSATPEYLNGELYYVYIFNNALTDSDRTLVYNGYSAPVTGTLTTVDTANTATTSYNLSGLSPGKKYDISMTAYFDNTRSMTQFGSYTTLYPPAAPLITDFSYVNTLFTTKWINGAGTITKNVVTIYDAGNVLRHTSPNLLATDVSYSTNVMIPGDTYYSKVASFNKDAFTISSMSNIIVSPFTTTGTVSISDTTYSSISYKTFTFTSESATLRLNKRFTGVKMLLVGGGGAGGSSYGYGGGGGGGGGEFKDITNIDLNAGEYNIVVGKGGIPGTTYDSLNNNFISGNINIASSVVAGNIGTIEITGYPGPDTPFEIDSFVGNKNWVTCRIVSYGTGTGGNGTYNAYFYNNASISNVSLTYYGRKGYNTSFTLASDSTKTIVALGGGTSAGAPNLADLDNIFPVGGSNAGRTNYSISQVTSITANNSGINGITDSLIVNSYVNIGGDSMGGAGGGGGGGGADFSGNTTTTNNSIGGNGGNGRQWINNVYYAGGGGGGYGTSSSGNGGTSSAVSTGGTGGGGSGSKFYNGTITNPVAGTANTGGGGGGGIGSNINSPKCRGAPGGSGIVIVYIPSSQI
jgi:hypothetical protein